MSNVFKELLLFAGQYQIQGFRTEYQYSDLVFAITLFNRNSQITKSTLRISEGGPKRNIINKPSLLLPFAMFHEK